MIEGAAYAIITHLREQDPNAVDDTLADIATRQLEVAIGRVVERTKGPGSLSDL